MGLRTVFLSAVAVLAFAPALPAQAPADRLPLDPQLITGELPNGLRYYIRENRRPEKRAELRLAVNAGSILEDDSQRGLAHFVEHMAFNGTRSFAKQELVSYLESIGMRFGADLNAYTSFDETVYMLQVPTDREGTLEKGIQILEEWAHAVTFDAEEIEKERGVVIEEWRLGQGASERLRQQYFPVLFRNSRYAERLPIGTREVLETFTRDELVRYYREWYRPDLMAIVAVGDFDGRAVERLVREQFGKIPAPASSARSRQLYNVPDHAETLVAVATDREATSTSVTVQWKHPPAETSTLHAYRERFARSLYSRMLNARLAELTQRANPPFIGAGSNYGRMIRTRDAYTLGANVPDGGLERGLETILTEAERVARHGFTATELEREKTNLLRAYERAYAERDKTESESYASEYVDVFLEGDPTPGIAWEYQQAQQLVPGIRLAEVNAYARQWTTDNSRVVVVLAPEKADSDLPDRTRLLRVFERVAASDIAPYDDVVADAPLVRQPPAAGRIVKREPVAGINAELVTLANGVQVYLMRTDFKDDQVLLGAFSPGGLSLVRDDEVPSAVFAGQLAQLSGVGELDMIQLNKALAGKAARVQLGVTDHGEMISGTASPRDVETMLQLVYLNFTAPRADTAAYESFISRFRAVIANRSASPESALQDTMTVTRWQHHPRARLLDASYFDDIDLGTSHRIYRERFGDASDFRFVMVGAFSEADITLIETYIGGLPTRGTSERAGDAGMRPARGVIEKVVRRGVEPKSQTHIVFSGPAQYDRDSRLAIALMNDVLDMRLRDVLREDLGGTYGVGIRSGLSRLPEPGYTVEIQFGAAPERLEELVQAVFTEIEALRTNGPDPDALTKVIEQQRRSYETNLKRNEYWLSVLMREAETGEAARLVLDLPQRLDAVTPERIRDAARMYLDTRNYVRVSLYPER